MKLNKKHLIILVLCFGFVPLFYSQSQSTVFAQNSEEIANAYCNEQYNSTSQSTTNRAREACKTAYKEAINNEKVDSSSYCKQEQFSGTLNEKSTVTREQICKDAIKKALSTKTRVAFSVDFCNNVRVSKDKCLSSAKACSPTTLAAADACIKKATTAGGGLVVSFCRDKANPQACQTNYQKACGGKTGNALKTCQTSFITELNNPDNVVSFCRNSSNPQSCQKEYQLVCGGKTGSALSTCQTEFAGAVSGDSTVNDPAPSLSSKYLEKKFWCGSKDKIYTQFNLGCLGDKGPDSGILDLAYAIIRFMSVGVGLVLIASMIYAGIMYTTSGGSPEQTTAAKNRIRDAVIALAFYLLIFAIVQFLVPGGIFS